jgi:hypothetical protein
MGVVLRGDGKKKTHREGGFGAGKEIRTLDFNLGKVALYR